MDTIKFEHKLSEVLLNESTTTTSIIRLINKQRKLRHLNPLSLSDTAEAAARIQIKQIERTGQFSHVIKGAKYPTIDDRIKASGLNCQRAGEVLYHGEDNPMVVVQSWLDSPQHSKAIMHPDITEIGAAIQYVNDRAYICAVVCIPSEKDKNNTHNSYSEKEISDICDKITNIIKTYGRSVGRRLLTKIEQSSYAQQIAKSPKIQKIIAALKQ